MSNDTHSTSDSSDEKLPLIRRLDADNKDTDVLLDSHVTDRDQFAAPKEKKAYPSNSHWFAALEKDRGRKLTDAEKQRLIKTKQWFQYLQAGGFVGIDGPISDYDHNAPVPDDLKQIQLSAKAKLDEQIRTEGLPKQYNVPYHGHADIKTNGWVSADQLSREEKEAQIENFLRERLNADPNAFEINTEDTQGFTVTERKAIHDQQAADILRDLSSMGDGCVQGDAQAWLRDILRPALVSDEEQKRKNQEITEKEQKRAPIIQALDLALRNRNKFRVSLKKEREKYRISLEATHLDPAEVDRHLAEFDADNNDKREKLEDEVSKHKRKLAKVNADIIKLQSFLPGPVELEVKYINEQIKAQWQKDIESATRLRNNIRILEQQGGEESRREIEDLRKELKELQDEINDQTKIPPEQTGAFSSPAIFARYLRKARKDIEKKLKEEKEHNETIEDESERLHHYLTVISPLQERLKLLTYAYTRADILGILRRKIDKEKGYKYGNGYEETGPEALARVPAFEPEAYEKDDDIVKNNNQIRLALLTGRMRISDIADRKGAWRNFKDGVRRFFTLKFGYLPSKTIDREEALRRAKAYKGPRDITIDRDKLVGYKFDWETEEEKIKKEGMAISSWVLLLLSLGATITIALLAILGNIPLIALLGIIPTLALSLFVYKNKSWFPTALRWVRAQFTFENFSWEKEKRKAERSGHPRTFFGLIPIYAVPTILVTIPIAVLAALGIISPFALFSIIPALALSLAIYNRPWWYTGSRSYLGYWWRSWGRRWTVGGFFSLFKVVNSVAICFTFTYLILGWPLPMCIAIAAASAISAVINRGPSMLDSAKYAPKEQRTESEHPLKHKSGYHIGFRLTTNFFMVLLGCVATGATSWFAINPIAAKIFGASVSVGTLYFIDILVAVSSAFSFYAFQGTEVSQTVKKYKKLVFKDKKGWDRFWYIMLSILFIAVYAFVTWFTVGKGMVGILGMAPGSVELTVALVSATTLVLVSTFSYVYKVMHIISEGTWKTLKNAVNRAISWVRETYKNNHFWGVVAGVFIGFILIVEIPLDMMSYSVAVGWTTSVSTLIGFNFPTWLSYFIGVTVVGVLIAVGIGFSWVVGAEKVIKLDADKRKQEHEVSPEEANNLMAEMQQKHPEQKESETEIELPQYRKEKKEELGALESSHSASESSLSISTQRRPPSIAPATALGPIPTRTASSYIDPDQDGSPISATSSIASSTPLPRRLNTVSVGSS